MSKHSAPVLLVAGALAVAGGLIMVASGFVTHSFLLAALDAIGQLVPDFIGGIPGFTIAVAIGFLALLIALGGITVVAGGVVLLARHRTTGRLLIALGGASGFLGFLVSFGYTTFKLGIDSAASTAPYWIGIILAVVARRLAKRA